MIKKLLNCPACNKSNLSKVISLNNKKKKMYLKFSELKYNSFIDEWLEILDVGIDRCLVCGHHFYREQPTQQMLSTMYEKGIALIPQSINEKRLPTSKMIRELSRLKKILTVTKPKMLDYGSGFGRWARAGCQVGFDVTAYEPSKERGAENSNPEFTIIHDLFDLRNQKFDIINLEQVLEHVPDPFEILSEIRSYCHTETILRISVPNILRCPEKKKLWQSWPYDGFRVHTLAPFEHLHGYTPYSLRTVANRAGYRFSNSFQIWRSYPREMLRFYIGMLFPKLGQTFLILKLSS